MPSRSRPWPLTGLHLKYRPLTSRTSPADDEPVRRVPCHPVRTSPGPPCRPRAAHGSGGGAPPGPADGDRDPAGPSSAPRHRQPRRPPRSRRGARWSRRPAHRWRRACRCSDPRFTRRWTRPDTRPRRGRSGGLPRDHHEVRTASAHRVGRSDASTPPQALVGSRSRVVRESGSLVSRRRWRGPTSRR